MKIITNNWNLKLTALALAVALWAHVQGQVNPYETAPFNVRLRVDPPHRMVLVNGAKIPGTVQVTLRAPRLTLRELKGTLLQNPLAPVEDEPRVADGAVRAWLDFSRVTQGDQNVPVRAASGTEEVEVIGIKPEVVVVTLDRAASKGFPIRPTLIGQQESSGIYLESATAVPSAADVSGALADLSRVRKVRARLHTTELKLNVPTTVRTALVALDGRGRRIDSVDIEPSDVAVTATAREVFATVELPVEAITNGSPAEGFKVSNTVATPSQVSVRGPKRALARLESIPVSVDVAGARDTLTQVGRVRLPDGVALVPSSPVRIHVEISPDQSGGDHDGGAPERAVTPSATAAAPRATRDGAAREPSTTADNAARLPEPAH